jgi:hypothetical protein
VEKIFALGKTDTAPALGGIGCIDQKQFSSPARNQNRMPDMRESLDSIGVLAMSKNMRRRAASSCARTLRAMSACDALGAKQDAFWARVHRPLSGVGVFFIALV